MAAVRGPRLLQATIQFVLADMSRGADSIPKSSQAGRAAPADQLPVRFTWIARSDGNEPDTLDPSRGDGRPENQRLGPQAEPKEGGAPATLSCLVGCAVAAHGREP